MDDEKDLSDADLWEKKRSEGMAADQATSYVQARKNRPGLVEGSLRAGVQGATFGFGDEAAAGLRGLMAMVPGGKSPNDAVQETLASEREQGKQFREDH